MSHRRKTPSWFSRYWWIVLLSLIILVGACIVTIRRISVSSEQESAESIKAPVIEQLTDSEPAEQIMDTEQVAQEDKEQEVEPVSCIPAVIENVPEGEWQAERTFPDQAGYVDNTLAMNSMYSFIGYSGQGALYLEVGEAVESFDLFVNNHAIDTGAVTPGKYELDISDIALNGTNTIQVSNIVSSDPENAITVKIPYPTVIDGDPAMVGIDEEPLKLIDAIVSSDVENGFSSAQLAIVKDGRLVYQNSWGHLNSYNQDGSRIEDGIPVTNDTMYDLASNTKMYATAYAIQYLVDKGDISLDSKVTDFYGSEFADDTVEIIFDKYEGGYPGIDTIREWKSRITVKDLLMHQAGFPDSGHYHNDKFNAASQKLNLGVDNILYVKDANKQKTLKEGIFRTPLIYKPGTRNMYSDIDYMLLGLIIEEVTGEDLNTFLKKTFWDPMGLTRISYCPTDNGFDKNDCAATELNGNTRDGLVDFPGVRTYTLQGEVHDEACYYEMEGVSGHAGLFASATDLAKLASVMLTGGYGNNSFFTRNTRDLFIAPQAGSTPNYGIGWWREGDDKRVWYFGTQAPESTVGHQGWTGTLTMIDFENNIVLVFLTNAINTPVFEPVVIDNANQFCGRYYTTSTLGFVPQILYTGVGNTESPDKALKSLIQDMVSEKQKLVDKEAAGKGKNLNDDHPMMKALKAIKQVADTY